MSKLQEATFAAGCFWGVEETFRKIPGVVDAEVGYTGGHVEKPTYEAVCSRNTGHAEAIRIRFDPTKVAYEALLRVFWASHDPTTRDRQGPDVGHQYRSAIFTHTEEQAEKAARSRDEAQQMLDRQIVTEIVPAVPFWRAEEYHQRYLERRQLRH